MQERAETDSRPPVRESAGAAADGEKVVPVLDGSGYAQDGESASLEGRGEEDAEAPETLSWRVHPFAALPLRGLAVLLFLALIGFGVASWMGSSYWGFFAFLLLFLSLEAYFLPTSFQLAPSEVVVRKVFSRSVRPWTIFRRIHVDSRGMTLSPFPRRNWLEAYRAIRLVFSDAGNRDAVIDYVLRHAPTGIKTSWAPGLRRPGEDSG